MKASTRHPLPRRSSAGWHEGVVRTTDHTCPTFRPVPLLLATVLLLGGCVVVAPFPPAAGRGSCNAGKALGFVGKTAGVAVVEAARAASGAEAARTIGPGDIVTMDFREDRLNLDLDASARIVRVRCG